MWKNDFNVILFAKNKKSQVPKFHRFVIDFGHRFSISLEAFSHKSQYLFDIKFCIIFWTHFWSKMCPKWLSKNVGECAFSVLFFATFSEHRSLVAFWSTLASFGRSFGHILVPSGAILLIHWFLKAFLMEVNPKKAPISRCGMLPFWHLFRDLFKRSICLCISVTLLLPLGYLLAPFWFVFVSFWLPFGTL